MSVAKKAAGNQTLYRFLFVLYAAAMLWLLFGQRLERGISYADYEAQLAGNMNLEPLKTIRLYWRLLENSHNPYLLRHAFINLAGNIVMFIPLGFFLPHIWSKQRNVFVTLLSVAVMIAVVETVQFFSLLGSCDIDDLILNLAGALLGYILWKFSGAMKKRR